MLIYIMSKLRFFAIFCLELATLMTNYQFDKVRSR